MLLTIWMNSAFIWSVPAVEPTVDQFTAEHGSHQGSSLWGSTYRGAALPFRKTTSPPFFTSSFSQLSLLKDKQEHKKIPLHVRDWSLDSGVADSFMVTNSIKSKEEEMQFMERVTWFH